MGICNCERCYCTRTGSTGRKAGVCLFCLSGEHGEAPREEPNRVRICRSCHRETVSLDSWHASCLACGAAFGRIALGFDRVSSREAGSPLTSASDFVRAMKATRRGNRAGSL